MQSRLNLENLGRLSGLPSAFSPVSQDKGPLSAPAQQEGGWPHDPLCSPGDADWDRLNSMFPLTPPRSRSTSQNSTELHKLHQGPGGPLAPHGEGYTNSVGMGGRLGCGGNSYSSRPPIPSPLFTQNLRSYSYQQDPCRKLSPGGAFSMTPLSPPTPSMALNQGHGGWFSLSSTTLAPGTSGSTRGQLHSPGGGLPTPVGYRRHVKKSSDQDPLMGLQNLTLGCPPKGLATPKKDPIDRASLAVKTPEKKSLQKTTSPTSPSTMSPAAHQARPSAASTPSFPPLHNVHYLIIIDFEATFDPPTAHGGNGRRPCNQEIIEFPMVVFDLRMNKVVDEFHHYVQPVHRPQLTRACVESTGIEQRVVDQASTFPSVFDDALMFITEYDMRARAAGGIFTFVTFGDWDLRKMLPLQCRLSGIQPPAYFRRWINMKKAFAEQFEFQAGSPVGMRDMLTRLQLPFIGKHHSGIDNARNVASALKRMIALGYTPKLTTSLELSKQT
ncbi:ERI1 exoribonuclease 3 [Dispira parvispora]|uniref:ERI1 exoribonuclease 3 n=1 Tax=Dispira parvispora TaxID=1520584 RepID=A0A9W8ANW9_9FUNG|nr:ERI1 exoribonuclease 3 [Dispira parvispora]